MGVLFRRVFSSKGRLCVFVLPVFEFTICILKVACFMFRGVRLHFSASNMVPSKFKPNSFESHVHGRNVAKQMHIGSCIYGNKEHPNGHNTHQQH